MNAEEQQQIIDQIRKQFEDDYNNTRLLMEADKVVDLVTPIMQRNPLTSKDLDEAISIARDHGFTQITEVFQLREKIRRF